MATYAVDSTLTGGRGSPNVISPGSDGNNWTNQRGNQTASFTGTQIKFVYNGSTTLGVWTYSALSENVIEVLCNVTTGNTSDIIGLVICQSGTSYYYCDIGNIAGKVEIGKAPSFTSLVSATFSWTAGTQYTIRFQYGVATSTTLQAKIWQTSGSEPGAWTVSTTDSTLSAGGGFGICMAPINGSSGSLFDTFSATNGSSVTTTTYPFTETLSAVDSLLGADGAGLTDSLTVSDTNAASGASFLVDGLTASDSLGNSGGFGVVESLSPFDTLLGANTFTITETLSVSEILSASAQLSFTEALSAADLLAANTGAQVAESLPILSQVAALSTSAFAESLSSSSQLSSTVLVQILEALSAADVFSAQEVTPAPPSATIPTALVFATFRSGVAQATYRNGKQPATYRDGIATGGGR